MKIKASEISDGEWDGKTVWICDLRYDDYANKPIRHVPPKEVTVRSSSETKQHTYYSNSYFSDLKKDGSPKQNVIKLFDNTGFRWRTGTPLQAFTTEEECRAAYQELATKALSGLDTYLSSVKYRVQEEKQRIKERTA